MFIKQLHSLLNLFIIVQHMGFNNRLMINQCSLCMFNLITVIKFDLWI